MEIFQVGTPIDKIDEFRAILRLPNEVRIEAIERHIRLNAGEVSLCKVLVQRGIRQSRAQIRGGFSLSNDISTRVARLPLKLSGTNLTASLDKRLKVLLQSC